MEEKHIRTEKEREEITQEILNFPPPVKTRGFEEVEEKHKKKNTKCRNDTTDKR
ncbi:MAG: hypothetical protein HPY57_13470 [Ignavibacteria bacterium]|nr:hypothetical protein [Ignavibacteria bacterium]